MRGKDIVGRTAGRTLDSPLRKSYPSSTTITLIDLAGLAAAPAIGFGAISGDRVIYLSAAPSGITRGELVVINSGDTADREARRVGDLFLLTLSTAAYSGYVAGTVVEGVNVVDQSRNNVVTDLTHIDVNDATGIIAGDHLRVLGGVAVRSDVVVQSVAGRTLTLRSPGLNAGHTPAANAVIPLKRSTADTSAGARVITLNNRIGLF